MATKNKFDNYIDELNKEADKIECAKLDLIFDSCEDDSPAEKALFKIKIKSLQSELDLIVHQIKILEKAKAENTSGKAA